MTTHRTLFAFAIYTLSTLIYNTSSAKENLDRSEEAVLERVSKEVKYLASDELAGRDVGTPGIDAAAEYIRSEFKKMEIASGVEDGSYYQSHQLLHQ